jgi:acetyl-CoA synthetase
MSALSQGAPTYEQAVSAFDWSIVLDSLGWSGHRDVDLAWTIADRHAGGARAEQTAILWIGADGAERRITYRELTRRSSRLGNLLRRNGVRTGDRVAAVMPRVPDAVPAIIGALRAGAIYVPIFSGFGADAVAYRIRHSGAKAVFVTERHRSLVPPLEGLTIIDVDGSNAQAPEGTGGGERAPADKNDAGERVRYRRDQPAVIIYTSGSSGPPKGCVIAANILAAMWPYAHYSLELRPDTDVFWPTGDPSWGYGLCCYLPALAMGATILCVEANATPEVCRTIIGKYKVTNLATTPTVLRSLMAQGDWVRDFGSSVRAISSCGEPLNGEVVEFFRRTWNVTPMDHFGATEFGLPIGNHNGLLMQVKPGSMGLPAPGQHMSIVGDDGEELPTDTIGLVAQRSDDNNRYWLKYWGDDDATSQVLRGQWACTGDLVRRDKDGHFWFEGRSDDIIKSSGYRIGPFEIESAILKHADVLEAAVVGVPDPLRGQAVKAYVVTRAGVERRKSLADEIVELVKATCGSHQYPRALEFVDSLPKTQTGKIQRFLLRQAAAKTRKPK